MHYIKGLKAFIREEMKADVFLSFQDAYNKTRKLEKVIRSSLRPPMPPLREIQNMQTRRDKNKLSSSKTASRATQKSNNPKFTYYKCIEKEHMSSNYSLRKVLFRSYEDDEFNGNVEFCTLEGGDKEADAKEYEEFIAVLQKLSLLGQKTNESQTQSF